MSNVSIAEIKATCHQVDKIEKLLLSNNADYKGEDHQIDTYFIVPSGRLKLREGTIENTLIFYDREEQQGIKTSKVKFLKLESTQVEAMKNILSSVHDVLVVVDKIRKIYFIDNVKFHIDKVENLGSFVEIEAIGDKGQDLAYLNNQCQHYQDLFEINQSECIAASYSDLLLEKKPI